LCFFVDTIRILICYTNTIKSVKYFDNFMIFYKKSILEAGYSLKNTAKLLIVKYEHNSRIMECDQCH
jgi:hypothetical protein